MKYPPNSIAPKIACNNIPIVISYELSDWICKTTSPGSTRIIATVVVQLLIFSKQHSHSHWYIFWGQIIRSRKALVSLALPNQ